MKTISLTNEAKSPIPLPSSLRGTIRDLHGLTRGGVGGAGQYKEKDSDIIEKSPDGRQRVRFQTVPASETAAQMRDLVLSRAASSSFNNYAEYLAAFEQTWRGQRGQRIRDYLARVGAGFAVEKELRFQRRVLDVHLMKCGGRKL